MVHADRPEEGDPGREIVDLETRFHTRAHVLDTVGQGVGELEVEGRPGLLHVVARNRDGIESRHAVRRVTEDIGDDPHRLPGWVDVGVANHELFENVVLDRAGELFRLHPLFFRGDDVERHDRQHRAVHCHRHTDVAERDAGEQDPHVEDRVHRHAGHANIASHTRIVRVVAPVGRQIEGDRQALLARGEIAAIKGVRVFGRGEARILADRPRSCRVHCRVGTAHVGRDAGQTVEVIDVFEIRRDIGIGDFDAFGRRPLRVRASQVPLGGPGTREVDRREVGDPLSHDPPPRPREGRSGVRLHLRAGG